MKCMEGGLIIDWLMALDVKSIYEILMALNLLRA